MHNETTTWRQVWPHEREEVVDIQTLAHRVNEALTTFGVAAEVDGVDAATVRYWRRPNVDILPPPVHEQGGYNRDHFTRATLARVRSKVLFSSLTDTRVHLGALAPMEVDEELDRLAARQLPAREVESAPQVNSARCVISLDGDDIEIIMPVHHRAWRDGRARRALLQRIGRALAENGPPGVTSSTSNGTPAIRRTS